MNLLISILRDTYNITINKNNLINGTEFLEKFKLTNINLNEYPSVTKKKSQLYINYNDCMSIIYKYNMTDLLALVGIKFQCEECEKIFTNRRNLLFHKTSKTACEKNKLSCTVCDRKYRTNALLRKHFKTPKHITAVNLKVVNNSSTANVINGNNNTHNTQINNNIYVIVQKEDFYDPNFWKKLTKDESLNVLKGGSECLQNLIKEKHFNTNRPEYNNVLSENIKDKRAAIYTKKEWMTKNIDDVATELVESCSKDIRLILKKHELDLTEEEIEKVIKCLNRIGDLSQEEIASHTSRAADMRADEAKASYEELVARMKRIGENKKKMRDNIRNIIYDGTRRMKLKR